MDLNTKWKELQIEEIDARQKLLDALYNYRLYLIEIDYDIQADSYGVKDLMQAEKEYQDAFMARNDFCERHFDQKDQDVSPLD